MGSLRKGLYGCWRVSDGCQDEGFSVGQMDLVLREIKNQDVMFLWRKQKETTSMGKSQESGRHSCKACCRLTYNTLFGQYVVTEIITINNINVILRPFMALL